MTLLSRLALAYRRPISGLYAGERRSPRAARSPEFADFRPYVAGDDFRQIDWRAYARLERPVPRAFRRRGGVPAQHRPRRQRLDGGRLARQVAIGPPAGGGPGLPWTFQH